MLLAPDLSFQGTKQASTNYIVISGIDASSGPVTALSLTGKHAISFLRFTSMSSESNTLTLTVDGVIIWNETYTMAAGGTTPGEPLLGMLNNDTNVNGLSEVIICETSFLLELTTAADSSVTLQYLARPIL